MTQQINPDILRKQLFSLSHPTRLTIVGILATGRNLATCEISELLGITESLTGNHLSELYASGLIQRVTNGRYKQYFIVQQNIENLLFSLTNILKGQTNAELNGHAETTSPDSSSRPAGEREDSFDPNVG